MAIYKIINITTGKQVRHSDGSLSPIFKYPKQGLKYIEEHFGNSPFLTLYRIG